MSIRGLPVASRRCTFAHTPSAVQQPPSRADRIEPYDSIRNDRGRGRRGGRTVARWGPALESKEPRE